MADVIVGLAAIAVGALFCFRGYLAMRIIIPIWGAFAGFVLGAGLAANLADDRFLGTAVSWIVGLVVGLLFGLLAYLYYEISIVLAMAAIGFSLGTSSMVAVGASWNWLIVLVGVLVGVLLAVAAIVVDLPMVLLTVLTALAGATAVVAGIMLAVGTITNESLNSAVTTERLNDNWWWYLVYVALAIGGIVVQLRSSDRTSGSMRDSWTADGGRQLRGRPPA
jgi:hypothetical protein